MVRLKDAISWFSPTKTSISIPYGAIKRNSFVSEPATEKEISIPYGAIKSQ